MAKRIKLANFISLIATSLSLLVTVSYGIWYVSSFDKRIALVEKTVGEQSDDLDSLHNQMDFANSAQDQSQRTYETAINERIINVENKMDDVHKLFDQLIAASLCGGK